jgi:AraC family transcriptional regulator, regulatory protein of adaptative response / methylated-DNA-[protein]-cysteine methyltransferase
MRLIVDEGALDAEGVTIEAFAERLGIGARHLCRLFTRHVGASPTQLARTARIQRGKLLLDETDLPMTQVALKAGFRSLRRFNAAFADLYGRAPSTIRRKHFAQSNNVGP